MRKSPRQPLSAYEKIIDYLSRRDHSEYELRTKLLQKKYPSDEIQAALEKVKDMGYLPDVEQLSNKVADTLHRKLKGILYIQKYLKSKDLPPITPDWEMELEKAKKLVHKQLKGKDVKEIFHREAKNAIFRFLASRGFTEQTIRKAVNTSEDDY